MRKKSPKVQLLLHYFQIRMKMFSQDVQKNIFEQFFVLLVHVCRFP